MACRGTIQIIDFFVSFLPFCLLFSFGFLLDRLTAYNMHFHIHKIYVNIIFYTFGNRVDAQGLIFSPEEREILWSTHTYVFRCYLDLVFDLINF